MENPNEAISPDSGADIPTWLWIFLGLLLSCCLCCCCVWFVEVRWWKCVEEDDKDDDQVVEAEVVVSVKREVLETKRLDAEGLPSPSQEDAAAAAATASALMAVVAGSTTPSVASPAPEAGADGGGGGAKPLIGITSQGVTVKYSRARDKSLYETSREASPSKDDADVGNPASSLLLRESWSNKIPSKDDLDDAGKPVSPSARKSSTESLV